MIRVASTRHGRAGRAQARAYNADYAAYRREQRKRNGDLRDVRCAATNTRGEPCKRFALADREHCHAHDPERAAERQRCREQAWAASRARMLRWGDHAPLVHEAIEAHGRPAVCRASGICTSVLRKMLGYAGDQPIKPETWRKLESGIRSLADGSSAAGALE